MEAHVDRVLDIHRPPLETKLFADDLRLAVRPEVMADGTPVGAVPGDFHPPLRLPVPALQSHEARCNTPRFPSSLPIVATRAFPKPVFSLDNPDCVLVEHCSTPKLCNV